MRRPPSATCPTARRRSGAVSLYFIAFMLITVPAMFVAIDLWRIVEGKVSQQRFCDAAAHAAALVLTTETTSGLPYSKLLYGDPTDIQNLCQTDCITEAKNYAAKNYVDSSTLDLDTTTVNKDVKFGKFDFNDATPTFALVDPTTASQDDRRAINAVRIEGFRTIARKNSVRLFGPAWTGAGSSQIVTRTTAVLDRRVVGFRIQNNLAATPAPLGYQTIPMVPVALLEEGTADAWKEKVEDPAADTSKPKLLYGTMTVKIPTSLTPSTNAVLLNIGVSTIADIDAQILSGITSSQMAVYNPTTKDMILDKTTKTVAVPKFTAPPYDTAMKSNFLSLKVNAGDKTDGKERIFPLYKVDAATVSVTGFVAALITDVQESMDGGGNSYISLTLQPTLLETPTAFTDYSNRFLKTTTNPAIVNSGPPSPYSGYLRLTNPYICRVRLVD